MLRKEAWGGKDVRGGEVLAPVENMEAIDEVKLLSPRFGHRPWTSHLCPWCAVFTAEIQVFVKFQYSYK